MEFNTSLKIQIDVSTYCTCGSIFINEIVIVVAPELVAELKRSKFVREEKAASHNNKE